MAGQTMSLGDTLGDAYLVRTDSLGNSLLIKNFPHQLLDGGNSINPTSDGGYLIAGHTETDSFDCQFYALRINANADTLWTRMYGGLNDDAASYGIETNDGQYVLAGFTTPAFMNSDAHLMRLDAYGNLIWSRSYGGNANDYANCIRQTADSGFILAGRTQSYGAGGEDIWLIKTDKNGNMSWSKTYGGAANERAYYLQLTSDGGYIIAGNTQSFGAGLTDMYVIKTNAAGDTLWTRTYGGALHDGAFCVQQTADGGYIVCGYSKSFTDTTGDVYLIKMDWAGNMQWTKTFGGTATDKGTCVMQYADGGYAVSGYTFSYGAGNADAWLIKTNAAGNITGGTEPVNLFSSVSIYPNPSHGVFTLNTGFERYAIDIYNGIGQKIYSAQISGKTSDIDLSANPKGAYLACFKTESIRLTKKIIIQ